LEYNLQTLLTSDEIDYLNTVYDKCKKEKVKRFYNLFYLIKASCIDDNRDEQYKALINKLEDAVGLKIYGDYFLEYVEGSFTKTHADNEQDVGKTVITLINKSDDLIGGESIGFEPHYKTNDVEFDINWYSKSDGDYNNGEDIIPVVMRQEVGESLIYPHSFIHGVSRVEKGFRRVFVTWFNNGK